MIRTVVVGANGKMGQEIIKTINDQGLVLSAGIDAIGNWKSFGDLDASQVDVLIDFSRPESFVESVEWCSQKGVPMVSGTTGLSNEEKAMLVELAKTQACLWSANMSLGVAFVNELIKSFKNLEEGFDFQIEEAHHRHKVDKPSGTALLLQNTLQSQIKKELPEPLSIRGGGIFGTHKLMAMSEEEIITLEHIALNRQVFAKGAVRAALWIVNQKPGFYSMKNVLAI